MLFHIIAVALLAFLSYQNLPSGTMSPERQVDHNVVTSMRAPAVKVRLPQSVVYVGADRWILYDIADCELHAFVESNSSHHVEKLYWVQFEQYIPSRPDLHHTYDSSRHTTLGGMDFFVDTWVRVTSDSTKSGSDLEHIFSLIRSKGFQMPEGMMYVRLVHLLDEQKRKELMIIYAEALPGDLTASALKPDGAKHDRWPALEQGLLERAKKNIVVEPLHDSKETPN